MSCNEQLRKLMLESDAAGLHPTVTRGQVIHADRTTITLHLQRPLRASLQRQAGSSAPVQWRLDKDEPASTLIRMRQNLLGEGPLASVSSIICYAVRQGPNGVVGVEG